MYHKIVNPETGRKVSVYNKLGKSILEKYILQLGGSHSQVVTEVAEKKIENEGTKYYRDQNGNIIYVSEKLNLEDYPSDELVNTERAFINNLNVLITELKLFSRYVKEEIRKKKRGRKDLVNRLKIIVKKKHIEQIIKILKYMVSVHNRILEILSKQHVCTVTSLKEEFIKLKIYYMRYSYIYEEIQSVATILRRVSHNIEKKNTYLKISNVPGLIQPIQRIMRYPMVYKEIIKRNRSKYGERKLANCRNICKIINKISKEIDRYRSLTNIVDQKKNPGCIGHLDNEQNCVGEEISYYDAVQEIVETEGRLLSDL